MKRITISSPDKISISMFLSFMRFCLGKDYKIVTLHSLMSKESLEQFIQYNMDKFEKTLFSYYAKGKAKFDPKIIIPDKLMDISDMVIWMNLYSIEWVVLKDVSNQASYYVDRWNKNMAKMNFNSHG